MGNGQGAVEELAPVVSRIRKAWPGTRIIVGGGSACSTDEIMSWCEAEGIYDVPRLERPIEKTLARSRRRCKVGYMVSALPDVQELEP